MPRVGSIQEARAFAEQNLDWIAKQLQKQQENPLPPTTWQQGTTLLYRGAEVQLIVHPNQDSHVVQFADQTLLVSDAADLRPAIERYLRKQAVAELTKRTWELAAVHGLLVKRVTVRNQRSRWGSCSRRGTISLNWRLIQMPAWVGDYVILHELAHTKEPNHSPRFWQFVAELCPRYAEARVWLNRHRGMLR